MRIMNPKTGKWLRGKAALDFALAEILLTPRASRTFHRSFGSRIMQFVDAGIDEAFRYDLEAENVQLLREYLPEFKYRTTEISRIDAPAGEVYFAIVGEFEGLEIRSKGFTL